MRRIPPVHYIRPETICIGDTLKIRWTQDDVEMSRTGTVAKREHYSHNMTEYLTASGVSLFMCFTDGTTTPARVTITLLDRRVADHPTLDIVV